MARALHKLTDRKVASLKEPGIYGDGGSLFLRISGSSKRWLFIYRRPSDKKRVERGLGGYPAVSLAQAREKAKAARDLLADGIDPREAEAEARSVPTFGELADQYMADNERAWANAEHRRQWRMLKTEAALLWSKPVDQITKADVLAVLMPIWHVKPTTASRTRGRIEKVLSAAKAKGFREGENPAAWRGHLELILPPQPKVARHHPAMPYDDVPAFMARLRERKELPARLLEFTILTCMRSSEARETEWSEIGFEAGIWTIPAERMGKTKREHRVPLSARAIEILREVEPLSDGRYVFPGQRRSQPLTKMTMPNMLERMGVTDATVHGFRSTFRDWAFECTKFPSDLVEMCLAHTVGSAVERAYRRGDALERRREIMEAWADFVDDKSNVVPLRTLDGSRA
jgi:integrase